MNYRKTLRAEDDLKAIHRYTSENFGETQADEYLLELDAVFELLASFPNMGPRYTRLTPEPENPCAR